MRDFFTFSSPKKTILDIPHKICYTYNSKLIGTVEKQWCFLYVINNPLR